ncbi:MAG: DNA-binding protein WhiA [Clostridiales bacterium]|nr:DNA-binding protein WhiA [Clostridiales bacterium]
MALAQGKEKEMVRMSFSIRVKAELIGRLSDSCCQMAELSAITHTGGSLSISSRGLSAEVTTSSALLAERVASLFEALYGVKGEVYSEQKSSLKKNVLYTVKVPELSERILLELGIISFDGSNHRQIVEGIDPYLAEQGCCKVSYLAGAFLACGSVSVPEAAKGKNLGYHLGFSLSNEKMAQDVRQLLSHFNIAAKIARKKSGFTVYLKEGEGIADFLALVGASKCVLELQEIMVEREVKNNTNRQTNCILANIDRSVSAAVRQIEAINLIDKKIGLNSLPQSLSYVARLRRQHPDLSLEAIASLSGGKLTKSGINHRMRKIIDIARTLEQDSK